MSQKQAPRRGLGRGLGSLIPTGPRPGEEPDAADGREPGAAYFTEIPVGAISPNPRQPREVFDEEAMTELAASVTEVGLLQPIVVRPIGEERFELIMGERRWRAAKQAGLVAIPAIVRQTGDDAMLRDALLENLHRAQLNPLEEAAAYQQMLDDFGCTHEELAGRIGRSRPQISNTIRLLKLSPAVQRRVAAGWELHAIAQFAGHRNTSTTLQYIHLSGRDLAAKLARGMAEVHAWRIAQISEVLGEPTC